MFANASLAPLTDGLVIHLFFHFLPKLFTRYETLYSVEKMLSSLLFSFFLCVMMTQTAYGQVRATVLNGTPIRDLIPKHSTQAVDPHVMPDVDVEGALRKDSIQGRRLPRYGVEIHTNLTQADGEMLYRGNEVIWKMAIYSREAVSLNFRMSDLQLPDGAQMFLYNADETMVVGPVETTNVHDGRLATTVIRHVATLKIS